MTDNQQQDNGQQQGPPPGPTGDRGPGASFFDSVRRAGLVRTDERWVGGVAGGVALRLGVDPLLVRGVVVVLTFFGGLGLLLYGLGWALLPEQSDGRIHTQQALAGQVDAGLAGALAMVIIGLSRPGFWWGGFWWGEPWGVFGVLVTIAVVLAVVLWAVPRMRSEGGGQVPPADSAGPATSGTSTSPGSPAPGPAPDAGTPSTDGPGTSTPGTGGRGTGTPGTDGPGTGTPGTGGRGTGTPGAARAAPSGATPMTTAPSPSSPSATTYPPGPGRPVVYAVLGMALLALALVQIVGRAQDWQAPLWLLGGGAVLTVLGLGILITGMRGRRAGGLGAWSVLTALIVVPLALTLAVAPQVQGALSLAPHNFGDVSWTPATEGDLDEGFTHTAGRVTVDLGALPADTGTDEPVEITLAAGQMVLEIPADADVNLTAQGTGSLRVQSPETWFTESTTTQRQGMALVQQEITMRSGSDPGPADLEVVASIGAGEILIRQLPATGND